MKAFTWLFRFCCLGALAALPWAALSRWEAAAWIATAFTWQLIADLRASERDIWRATYLDHVDPLTYQRTWRHHHGRQDP